MFAKIYTGCQCKNRETWQVQVHSEFNIDNDKEYQHLYCALCYGDNLTEKIVDGVQCFHELSHEEIQAEIEMGVDNENEDNS